MIGNFGNDLKMVKNEIKLLQGYIKNFKEERHSLLLQTQKKNKDIEIFKINNDSLVKMNAYCDKESLVNYRFVKEKSRQLEEILRRQVYQQKLNHDPEDLWLSQVYFLVTRTVAQL
ncbi:hypothetical protein AVEN_126121-1 [Araneus ventricosus]|uniref:Uncharacterized protein n=1 Tax=Araneus ventricosus TaxID=182803 RepID=A0A4Y2PJP6_ARAVE|nr:hypothetical protein AVEN_126121-1 [Araneus ventricosus]